MKKKLFHWMLLATMTCGLSLPFVACSDDDDDNKSEEQQQEEAEQANDQANLFWNVVGQLAGTTNYTADYADKTFEPTIGTADEGSQYTRVVALNNMKAAAQSFADLVGANIDESTPSFEYKNDAVGTLTYTRVDDGRTFATVDVSIEQMPHLQRIVYMNADQMGDNAAFNGAAYYRFGDVIKQKGKFWVCVRPSFGPEKKSTSHWITVDTLDAKNIKHITKGGKEFWVPTGLGKNKEHMQNLAEMLYAMLKPVEWRKNIEEDAKLAMFHDFNHAKLPYHNVRFWDKVRANWEKENLFLRVFHVSEEQMLKAIEGNGLNFLYSGYSWWSSVSWNLSLYQMNYKGKNMSIATKTERKEDMSEYGSTFIDVREEYWNQWTELGKFFGDEDLDHPQPRWIIRHATGEELCVYDKYNVQEKIDGCDDIYTYYEEENVKNLKPEVTTSTGLLGDLLCTDCNFYANQKDAEFAKTDPVGIVVYKGEAGTSECNNFNRHACGLVMMLDDYTAKDGEYKFSWANDEYATKFIDNGTCFNHLASVDNINNEQTREKDLLGLTQEHNANQLASQPGRYPLFDCMKERYDVHNFNEVKPQKFSKWFVPTLGDFVLVFETLMNNPTLVNPELKGNLYLRYRNKYNTDLPNMYELTSDFINELWKPIFERSGVSINIPTGTYWTNTETEKRDEAWMVYIGTSSVNAFKKNKTEKNYLRLFLSFAEE